MKCSIVRAKYVYKVTKDSAAMKALYHVLKDHKNPMIQDLIKSWYERCYRDEMEILVVMVIRWIAKTAVQRAPSECPL